MADMKNPNRRSVKITRRRGIDKGRIAVVIEMTAEDWAWMEELEDRRMIPLPDMLYSGFFQGMEREGWKNPEHVTTPDNPPPRTHALRNNADNVVQLNTRPDYDGLDKDIPF